MELLNMTAWINVAKPTGQNWTAVPKPTFPTVVMGNVGSPIGLLLALTYSDSNTVVTDPWTKISKPSGTNWTSVTKPTT